MTPREKFIEELEDYISHETVIPFSEEAWSFFQSIKSMKDKEVAPFTEKGAHILIWLQQNYASYNNVLKAKDIAEGMFVASKSVSGAMRKLVTDGYVEKIGKDPVVYTITEKGLNVKFEGEN
jgi:DNA-binding MarR family transcriptional regulator